MSAEITPERLAEIETRAAKVVEVFGDDWPLEYDRDFNEVVCRYEDEDAPFTNVFIEVFRTSQWPEGSDTSPVAEFLAASIVDIPALLGEVERLQERNAELGHRYAATAQLHPLDQTGGYSVCATCRRPYPCPTLRTLDKPSPAAAVQFDTDGAPGA